MIQIADAGMSEQTKERWTALLNKYNFTCPDRELMALRYSCGLGWMPILDDLFAEIEREARSAKLTEITILQVKEKFGDLVVDVSSGNVTIDALIKAASRKAAATCEGCGRPGKKTDCDGWYKTLCPGCYANRDW